jgi:hypothetical protein
MDELIRAHRVRDAVQDGPFAAVDEDLPAAAQPQLRALVVDVLRVGVGTADLSRDRVRRRVRIDLDEQRFSALETAQSYPVGTQANVDPV